ncbi:hypothetical protein Btru_017821 [Bulinus truncatus]|nr:hypothetical protein Btru_017821 [Bulinus truncatus]
MSNSQIVSPNDADRNNAVQSKGCRPLACSSALCAVRGVGLDDCWNLLNQRCLPTASTAVTVQRYSSTTSDTTTPEMTAGIKTTSTPVKTAQHTTTSVQSSLVTGSPANRTDDENCGLTDLNPESQVIHGDYASEKAWPWMGLLRGEVGSCGAVLISEQWVITAAHCLPGVYSVSFGQTDKSRWTKKSQVRYADYEVAHHSYSKRGKFADIAMVKLDRPVQVTDYVRPACLPHHNITYTACYATGWGKDSPHKVSASRYLKQLRVALLQNNVCAYRWLVDGTRITDTHICLARNKDSPRSGICEGDSGSPLNCRSGDRYYAAAVASFVERGCEKKYLPDVYTRVLPFLDWVRDTMDTYS